MMNDSLPRLLVGCAILTLAATASAQAPPKALEGHASAVTSVGHAPDGHLLVTGSYDRTVRIWDAASGSQLRQLVGHEAHVLSVAVHPAGEQLASASRLGAVKLWDLYRPSPERQLAGHTDGVSAVLYGHPGDWLATGGDQGGLKLWGRSDGQLMRELAGHAAGITRLAVSPQGTELASGDSAGNVRLWGVEDGAAAGVLGAHTAAIRGLAYHPTSPVLMTAGEDGAVKLWQLPPMPSVPLAGHDQPVRAVALLPDGSQIVTGSQDGSLRVFDQQGKLLRSLEGQTDPVTAVDLHAATGLVAAGGSEGRIRLWNGADAADRGSLSGHEGGVRDVAFHPTGKQLVSAGEDGTLRLWRVPPAARTLTGHTQPVTAATASPDGSLLATGSADKTVRLHRLDAPNAKVLSGAPQPVQAVAIRPDQAEVAAGDAAGNLLVWDVAQDAPRGLASGHVGPITAIEYTAEGTQLITAGTDGTLHWWRLPLVPPRSLPQAAQPISRLAVTRDGKQIIQATVEGGIQVLDATSGQVLRTLSGHVGPVLSLAVSEQLVASGDGQGTIRFWKLADGSPLPSIVGHEGPVHDLAFHPQGSEIGVASADGTARVYRVPSAGRELAGPTLPVEVVAFSADGTLVASGGMSGGKATVVVRETASGTVKATLVGHEAAVVSLAFSPDRTKLLSGSADKTARVWNLAAANAPELSRFAGHAGPVSAVAWHPGGGQAFSGATDGTLKQWNVADGQEIRALAGHPGGVTALDARGAWLASGGNDKHVRLWNVANGAAVRAIPQGAAVRGVALRGDGQLLASAGADNLVKLWNPASGAAVATLTGHTQPVRQVAFPSQNPHLLSLADDGIRIWNVTGQTLQRVGAGGQAPRGAVFSADGMAVLAVDAGHTLHHLSLDLAKLLAGHTGPVHGVAFLPAGTGLVTCGQDQTVRLWNLADGKPLATFAGPSAAVSSLAVSADGKRLAAASADKSLRVWEIPAAATTTPVAATATFSLESPAASVALAPDGTRLVAAGDAPLVSVWDVGSGRLLERLSGHTAAPSDVAFLADGRTLVTAGADKIARLWTLASGPVAVAADGPVHAMEMSADGSLLVTAGGDKRVRLWNATDGQSLHELTVAGAAPTCVAIRPDKTQLAAAAPDNKLYQWPLAAAGPGAVVTTATAAPQLRLEYVKQGQRLIAATGDKQLRVYDSASRQLLERVALQDVPADLSELPTDLAKLSAQPSGAAELAPVCQVLVPQGNQVLLQPLSLETLLAAHEGPVTAAAFTADGAALVSGGADKALKLWSLADGKLLRQFVGAGDAVTDLALASELLAASSADKTTRIWSLKDTAAAVQPTGSLAHTEPVVALDVTPDGSRLATVGGDAAVRVWDLASGRELQRFTGHEAAATDVRLAADGKSLVSAGSDKTARLWRVSAQGMFVAEPEKLGEARWLPDGNSLATAGDAMQVTLWEPTGKPLRKLAGAKAPLTHLAIRQDALQLAAGDAEGRCLLWSLADGALQQTLETGQAIRGLDFSSDNTRLAIAGADGSLAVHDVATAERLYGQTVDGSLTSVAFSPDGRQLLTGTSDKRAQLWRYASPRPRANLAGHTGAVYQVAYNPAGTLLATAGADTTVRLWDLQTGQAARQLTGHGGPVYAIRFSADGQHLVSTGADGTVRIWNVANGGQLRQLASETGEGRTPPKLFDVAISEDGQRIAASGDDRQVRLWNAANGQLLRTVPTADQTVYRLRFLAPTQLLGCGHAGHVGIWNTDSGAEVFSGQVAGVAYSASLAPTARRLAVPCADGRTYFLTLP